MAGTVRRHVVVTGRVQGVGFRFHTQAAARRLGITGWVRNLSDGTVEAEIEGTQDSVDDILAWLDQGPASAEVESVAVTEIEPRSDAGGAGPSSTTGFFIR